MGGGEIADAVRLELAKGEFFEGKLHLDKAITKTINLENIIKNESLSLSDLEIA